MRFIGTFILLIFIVVLNGCKNSKENPDFEQIPVEPDPFKRAKQAAEKGGGIFNLEKRDQGSIVNFSNSNVLWRATIKTLDFLPLANADYSGGIIIYDWFSQANNPKEQIKISVQFLSNELRSDSIKITAHKKICESNDRCSNSTIDQNFANSIKDSIIFSARTLKIEETKKEKK
jgi:hypothetical protein